MDSAEVRKSDLGDLTFKSPSCIHHRFNDPDLLRTFGLTYYSVGRQSIVI